MCRLGDPFDIIGDQLLHLFPQGWGTGVEDLVNDVVPSSGYGVVPPHRVKPTYHLFDACDDVGFLILQMLAFVSHLKEQHS